MPTKEFDLKEYAERVERLCEFFLAQVERNGSKDLGIIEDLKEESANIQAGILIEMKTVKIDGLSSYMSGLPPRRSSDESSSGSDR